jgi:hypothetical protein
MKVREEQRRALFERLRAQLDEETATLMLEVTVPANVDLATRGDVQELRMEMLALFTRLDGRINAFDAKVDTKFNALVARIDDVDAQVKALGTELLGKISWVVIPVLAALTLAIVGVATWIGTLVG